MRDFICRILLRLLGLDPGRDLAALHDACAEQAAKRLRTAGGWAPCSLERYERGEDGRYSLMVWTDGNRWSAGRGWQKAGRQGQWS